MDCQEQTICPDQILLFQTDHQTSVGVIILGAGNRSLVLDNWYFKINNLTVFASTTPVDCIPVGESLFGQIGEGKHWIFNTFKYKCNCVFINMNPNG